MTKPIAKPITLTAKLCCQPETTPALPKSLALELTAEQVAAIADARAFMASNCHINMVNVRCTPPKIDGWRYDICYLSVFETNGCYLLLQGEDDRAEQVEYSVEI